jgi:hypothetical protein
MRRCVPQNDAEVLIIINYTASSKPMLTCPRCESSLMSHEHHEVEIMMTPCMKSLFLMSDEKE